MDLKEIGCEWKECSWLVQEKVAKWAFNIMNFRFHRELGIFGPLSNYEAPKEYLPS
jgi:hypothetical protein